MPNKLDKYEIPIAHKKISKEGVHKSNNTKVKVTPHGTTLFPGEWKLGNLERGENPAYYYFTPDSSQTVYLSEEDRLFLLASPLSSPSPSPVQEDEDSEPQIEALDKNTINERPGLYKNVTNKAALTTPFWELSSLENKAKATGVNSLSKNNLSTLEQQVAVESALISKPIPGQAGNSFFTSSQLPTKSIATELPIEPGKDVALPEINTIGEQVTDNTSGQNSHVNSPAPNEDFQNLLQHLFS